MQLADTMNGETLAWIKLGLALLAGFAWWRLLGGSERARRWATALLVLCALGGVGAYFRFGDVPRGYVHRWEMFHYYLGSKYHAELGYKSLYRCVVLADAEGGVPGSRTRRLRDLHTDQLITAERALAEPRACKAGFSASRWRAFSADVAEFRRQVGSRRVWQRMQLDHGYNPPPLWSVLGGTIAGALPPTPALLTLIALFDVGLMAGCLALLGWAFGLRVALLAAIFWGTQAASDIGWTGGAFLRQDWLFCSVLAIALLRKRYFFAAGAALASAALLRFFPLLFCLGPLLVVAVRSAMRRSIGSEDGRFLLGLCSAALALALLSVASVGSQSYLAFLDHIRIRHLAQISNHMGLRTLFSYSSDTALGLHVNHGALDPAVSWQAARNARVDALWPWFVAFKAGLVLFAAWVLQGKRRLWMAMALAVTLVPIVSEPSCYYYSMWVLVLPLVSVRPVLAIPWLGLVAASQLVCLRPLADDARFAALAALYLLSAVVVLASFARAPGLGWRGSWFSKEMTNAVG